MFLHQSGAIMKQNCTIFGAKSGEYFNMFTNIAPTILWKKGRSLAEKWGDLCPQNGAKLKSCKKRPRPKKGSSPFFGSFDALGNGIFCGYFWGLKQWKRPCLGYSLRLFFKVKNHLRKRRNLKTYNHFQGYFLPGRILRERFKKSLFSLLGPCREMGIFWLKAPFSAALGNGSFLTPKPFSRFWGFWPLWGVSGFANLEPSKLHQRRSEKMSQFEDMQRGWP